MVVLVAGAVVVVVVPLLLLLVALVLHAGKWHQLHCTAWLCVALQGLAGRAALINPGCPALQSKRPTDADADAQHAARAPRHY
jgi:hypothetical protein